MCQMGKEIIRVDLCLTRRYYCLAELGKCTISVSKEEKKQKKKESKKKKEKRDRAVDEEDRLFKFRGWALEKKTSKRNGSSSTYVYVYLIVYAKRREV